MLSYFRDFFKKKPKLEVKDLTIGVFLELEYKHPKSVGIITPNSLTCTRLNSDELENRKIQGFATNKYFNKELRIWFVSVRSCKKVGNEIIERDYLFLENEIERIRLLN